MQAPKRRGRRDNGSAMSRIPARLNVLLGIVIVILGALGWRLGSLQLAQGAKFKAEVNSSDSSIEQMSVQRGIIYDSSGKALVTNKGSQAITYTKPKNVTDQDMYKTANEVSRYVKIDTKGLSQSNVIKYYIQDSKRAERLAKEGKIVAAPGTDQYVNQLTDYAEKHRNEIKLDANEKNAAMLFQKMENAYSLSTVYLKQKDVTQNEIASVGERQSKMPGVNVGIYYKREGATNSDKSLQMIVGTVSKTGLPEDQVNSLIEKGYSRDDNVGTSGLEQQYEDILKGTKRKVEFKTDEQGNTKQKVLYKGRSGSDLKLTINAKFQKDVQQILKNEMPGGATQGAYSVVMNPKTGAVYAMGGVNRTTDGGTEDDALATINRAEVVGSVVKPAMIVNGLMRGTITPTNNTFVDQPIHVAGTSVKASYFNQKGQNSIPLTASDALEVSSNSYVMQLMLKMSGHPYVENMSLQEVPTSIFQKMREGFNRFGLGVKTGIDLPGETAGLRGETDRSHIGNALDESFGQYDTYTTMQLAQYVSTIANGGYRIQPHVVDTIEHQDDNSKVLKTEETVQPKSLGSVGWTDAQRQVIWDGMDKVVNGTSQFVTGGALKNLKPGVYAKTGTAETFTNGEATVTSSLIMFSPNHDVALSVVVPGVSQSAESVNIPIAKEIYNAYWKDVESSKNNN
ncbi:cell division protein FtsI/penicillin-binding protein 2 [Weissella uvarum]|uniref:peptidoglycan D,D-transpeptidase FtsI family protein n=1 Tax=Weissella uvarum TaxID=1479233 RepID=UPI0019620DBE|nr:penicillin-binding protein 2 [Weissella uvarum]MBM7616638.1 cell division protein FtsI/penicillin-binding protein 2 [Weissella uvarum]MCM0594904.1 penicillin-binding protein 2 [Weissella uvarum]